eukprot:TRINITY_DN519_c0_g1_i2.p1 TRINITY_DN519_c0_g1~~TRINITY_DN519_c0_g1_i2.p1  ORF type:complete len:179 (+),score=13.78 TRINITY_DN519_c0_g1_i2:89-625(+)
MSLDTSFNQLYVGCFSQHILQSLFKRATDEEVLKRFILVQGKIAGADGLSAIERQLAIDITMTRWYVGLTAEEVLSFLEAGSNLSVSEAVEHIEWIARHINLPDNRQVCLSTLLFALTVSAADGISQEEENAARSILIQAGLSEGDYNTVVQLIYMEMSMLRTYSKLYGFNFIGSVDP